MKKVALMQPYFLPYLGYFQLINAVDLFIVYDDVQWMKGGWINRNKILINNNAEYITLPVKKSSRSKYINEREFTKNIRIDKNDILHTIEEAYREAPYFSQTIKVIEDLLTYDEENVALFIYNSINKISEYLEINTTIIMSSSVDKDNSLRSQDRVIDICKSVEADMYVNAIGGQDLYDRPSFLERNIQLKFIEAEMLPYIQHTGAYVPYLSIVDIMMFNSRDEISTMLKTYKLI